MKAIKRNNEDDGRGPPPVFPDGIQSYDDTPKLPGLYIGLFHGRQHKDARLKDWGHQGPLIGPLNYVQTTYGDRPRFSFVNPDDAQRFLSAFPELGGGVDEGDLPDLEDGMVKLGGYYYGDYTVFHHPPTPKKGNIHE